MSRDPSIPTVDAISFATTMEKRAHYARAFSLCCLDADIPFIPATEFEQPKQPKTLPKAILSVDAVESILHQQDIQ